MEEILVSIIVPIYKVEKYLRQCIESIIEQTHKNIEILLIDDGSPDTSLQICEEYAKKDSRIKVFSKPNGGLSDARNYGLERCKGKYIAFIDSDDYVHKEYIQELLKKCIETKSDIAMCGIKRVDDNGQELEEIEITDKQIQTGKEMILEINDYSTTNVVAWNKLYKRHLFNNIEYPKGKLHEDEFTTHKLLYNANQIAITQEKLYFYRYNANSIMNSSLSIKRLHILEALEDRLKYFKTNNEEEIYNNTIIRYIDTIIYLYNISNAKKDKEIRKKILEKYKELYKTEFKKAKLTTKKKLKIGLFKMMPNLYTICQKQKEKLKH